MGEAAELTTVELLELAALVEEEMGKTQTQMEAAAARILVEAAVVVGLLLAGQIILKAVTAVPVS